MTPTKLVLEMRSPQSAYEKEPTNLVNFVLQSLWVYLEVVIQPLALSKINVTAARVEAEVTVGMLL